jgi:hypothetical protein
MSETVVSEPRIHFVPDGSSTRAELLIEERAVSRLWIVPFTLTIGAARVRMDGIGGVGTDEEHRRRGYSRQVLEATVRRMREGDAALSMLYGIRDFYPKFGYATAGPDHFIRLTDLSPDAAMPAGWSARSIAPGDLATARRLYDLSTARTVGASVRREDGEGHTWSRLRKVAEGTADDACRVVVNPEGVVAGYVWQGKPFWYHDMLRHDHSNALILSEVMAAGPAAADAALAACRIWAAEEARRREKPVREVLLSHPPEGLVAAAAMRQDAAIDLRFSACGSSMARVLNVERLLRALAPELAARAQAARLPIAGTLRIEAVDEETTPVEAPPFAGGATLEIGPDGVTVAPRPPSVTGHRAPGADFTLRLPQAELARLALGVFPPGDVLARLPSPPDAVTAELVGFLFPRRHPHMWIPDRF